MISFLKPLLLALVANPLASSIAYAFQHAVEASTINVEFEYQLEVQDSQAAGSIADALGVIDGVILSKLQNQLPEINKEGNHLVKFSNIQSRIFSACFTSSAACSLVRSSIEVVFEGARPGHSVEVVALQLVEEYLEEVTASDNHIIALYRYPFSVSMLTTVQLSNVAEEMSSNDIKILENTFLQVFGAIVYAIEGDTEIRSAKFLYQDLLVLDDRKRGVADTLSADLRISGYCRDCTQPEFQEVVVRVIEQSAHIFMNRLKLNSNDQGSAFFDGVNIIAFSVPQLPDPMQPISDSSIYDAKAPTIRNRQPWFLWFGTSMAVLIVCVGCYFVIEDSMDYEKDDDYSTGESSEEEFEDESVNIDVEAISADEADNFHSITIGKAKGKNEE